VLDKRGSPFPVNHKFFLYQFFIVINTFRPVSTHVVSDAAVNVLSRAIENNKRMNNSDPRDVLSLPRMTGYSIQNE